MPKLGNFSYPHVLDALGEALNTGRRKKLAIFNQDDEVSRETTRMV